MDLLEAESTGAGTPQGVVLALVGPEGDSPKDQETVRAIRMYNLASLINLAKWAIVQEVRLEKLYCFICVNKIEFKFILSSLAFYHCDLTASSVLKHELISNTDPILPKVCGA